MWNFGCVVCSYIYIFTNMCTCMYIYICCSSVCIYMFVRVCRWHQGLKSFPGTPGTVKGNWLYTNFHGPSFFSISFAEVFIPIFDSQSRILLLQDDSNWHLTFFQITQHQYSRLGRGTVRRPVWLMTKRCSSPPRLGIFDVIMFDIVVETFPYISMVGYCLLGWIFP